MTALTPEQALHFEALIDALEQQRQDAQSGLKDALSDLREALAKVIHKSEIAAEVAGLRGAVKRRRMERTEPEKARKIEEKVDLADQYYFLLQKYQNEDTAHTPSAQRATGFSSSDTPFDPATGEIIETIPVEPGAEESCGSAVLEDRKGTATGVGGRGVLSTPAVRSLSTDRKLVSDSALRPASADEANTSPPAGSGPQDTNIISKDADSIANGKPLYESAEAALTVAAGGYPAPGIEAGMETIRQSVSKTMNGIYVPEGYAALAKGPECDCPHLWRDRTGQNWCAKPTGLCEPKSVADETPAEPVGIDIPAFLKRGDPACIIADQRTRGA